MCSMDADVVSNCEALEIAAANSYHLCGLALTPATTALPAKPVLGEWPSAIDWVAITVISAGVYLLSGAPFPRIRTQEAS